MKNKENYCKFVIQFNSIQFNSIPKIVSLIVLLFILLFSISCKSKQKPEEHSRAELAGIWDTVGGTAPYIYVLDDGDVMYRGPWSKYFDGTGYFGKVAATFDSYPYTIKLIVTNVTHHNSADGGTITFKSATVCEYNTTKSINKNGDLYDNIDSGTKVKKWDIASLNKTKEEIWNSVVWY